MTLCGGSIGKDLDKHYQMEQENKLSRLKWSESIGFYWFVYYRTTTYIDDRCGIDHG